MTTAPRTMRWAFGRLTLVVAALPGPGAAAEAVRLQGDPQAVQLVERMLERMGGREATSTRSLRLEDEGWRTGPDEAALERAWRDLQHPNERIEVEMRTVPEEPEAALRPRLAGILVPDLDRAKRWYRDTLGFAVVEEKVFPEAGLRLCFMRSGTFELELVENKKAVPRMEAQEIEGWAKLAFAVDDLGKLHRRLLARHATVVSGPAKSTRTGQLHMLVRDDSGNLLQFFEARVPTPAQEPKAAEDTVLGRIPAPFMAVSVADIDGQVAWYRDKLGFKILSEGTAGPAKIRFALLKQGDVLVELLQIPDAKPRRMVLPGVKDAGHLHGFFKGGMVVADVEGLFKTLKQQGVTIAFDLGKPPNGPYRVFGIRDPEGNLLQFFGR